MRVFASEHAYIMVHEQAAVCARSMETASGAMMTDEPKGERDWTAAERQALRKLIRMALILLLAIAVAGTIAALLSSALGTV